ncbi:type I-B CRISPR-associated protein Cas5b [Rummeliibacillus sp. SL167]|uniref:type I-B CRISPR-associated protein Cas5b n=1 Tax=Rummeliibacillus sp. SL167 TaxID=2579792 RepID=UPI0011B7E8CF|nr:type I-B CRISPR-associated protein Cas5b [Rummeliibacillus sp. SL167]
MKLLRLKIFQETACYQKPFAFKVGETYPLAPFSTVKGMLHAVLGATEYIPMNLSIQGQSESMLIDYQKKYIYKKNTVPALVSTAGLPNEVEIDSKLVSTMPMYQHLLLNVEHVIHIEAEESVLNTLYEKFQHLDTAISLGRWEDVVRIDEVDFVEVKKQELEETLNNQYIPFGEKERFFTITNNPYYRLPRKYEIHNDRRTWDYVTVLYVTKGETLEIDEVLSDGKYSVFLMEG